MYTSIFFLFFRRRLRAVIYVHSAFRGQDVLFWGHRQFCPSRPEGRSNPVSGQDKIFGPNG